MHTIYDTTGAWRRRSENWHLLCSPVLIYAYVVFLPSRLIHNENRAKDDLYFTLPLSIEETGYADEQPLLASNLHLHQNRSAGGGDADASAPDPGPVRPPLLFDQPRFMAHQRSMALNFELVGHVEGFHSAVRAPAPIYVDRENQQVLLPQSTFRQMIDAIPWGSLSTAMGERSTSGLVSGQSSPASRVTSANQLRQRNNHHLAVNGDDQPDSAVSATDNALQGNTEESTSRPSRTVELSDVAHGTARHQGSVSTALLVLSAKCLSHIPRFRLTANEASGTRNAGLLRNLEIENTNAVPPNENEDRPVTGRKPAWFQRLFKLQVIGGGRNRSTGVNTGFEQAINTQSNDALNQNTIMPLKS